MMSRVDFELFMKGMLLFFSVVGGSISVSSGLLAAGIWLESVRVHEGYLDYLGHAVNLGVAVGFLLGLGIMLVILIYQPDFAVRLQ